MYENIGKILSSLSGRISIMELDTNGYNMSDTELKIVANGLNRLSLRKSRNSEETLIHVINHSPGLVTLNLANCAFATDVVLERIAGLKCLKELNLSNLGASPFGSLGLGCLFRSLAVSNLVDLSLVGCNTVTDDNMIALAENAHNLSTLNCSGCFNIGDTGLQAVLRIQTLHTLSVSFCWRITDDAWNLPEKHTHLSSVEMPFCYQLSGRIVPYLGRILVAGCRLNLANCEYVTEDDKKQLQCMGFNVE
jgi:hypothetical protein